MSDYIKSNYKIQNIGDSKYKILIKSKLDWLSGFAIFLFFVILLVLAFFVPIGFSISKVLKIVGGIIIAFILLALFGVILFSYLSKRSFIFDIKNRKIIQDKKNRQENWLEITLPENCILVRDFYRLWIRSTSGVMMTTGSQSTKFQDQLISVERLFLVPIEKGSLPEVIEKLNQYELNLRKETFTSKNEPELFENSILISEGTLFSEYQDALIENLINLFNLKLIDYLVSPPEIYDKDKMQNSIFDKKIFDNIKIDQDILNIKKSPPLIKVKFKNDKIIFKIKKINVFIKLVVLIFLGALSAFYAFFAKIKNDTEFIVGFTPMFLVWVLILSINSKLIVKKDKIILKPTLLFLSLPGGKTILPQDIGDIKITVNGNKNYINFYKKRSRSIMLKVEVPSLKAGNYIISNIINFYKS